MPIADLLIAIAQIAVALDQGPADDGSRRRARQQQHRGIGGNAQSGLGLPTSGGVDEDIGRLEILMNQPTSVELPDCAGQRRGDSEERSDLHRLPDEAIERLAACVVDHEHRLPALADEFQWPQRPGTIQVALKSVFVRETIDAGESWMRTGRIDGYERVPLALSDVPP